jgi:hypothetical protein
MIEAEQTEPTEPTEGIVGRVVSWLRAGYPTGVPEQDYVPLLGILRRNLTPAEIDKVVDQLVSDATQAETAGGSLGPVQLRDRVEHVLRGPALPEDLVRVSARLASAGWPLSAGDDLVGSHPQTLVRTGLVSRIVQWLREGYPAGLPEQDFVPLVALLRRRLTDDEVADVAHRLTVAGHLPATKVDVGTAIAVVTSELPSDEDITRVRSYLAGHGWPEDFPI